MSGDLGFCSGENRAACHNIRLDIRVIARESLEHYGGSLRFALAPRLCRRCRDRLLELITLDYHCDVTSACIGDAFDELAAARKIDRV